MIVNSAEKLKQAISHIEKEWDEHKFLRVKITHGKDRSLAQNRLQHQWYLDIEKSGLKSKDEARADCKLEIGVMIMIRDDEKKAIVWKYLSKDMVYAQKLRLAFNFPVTRDFSVDQMSEYLSGVEGRYRRQGVVLTNPEEYGLDGRL